MAAGAPLINVPSAFEALHQALDTGTERHPFILSTLQQVRNDSSILQTWKQRLTLLTKFTQTNL